MAAVDPTPGLPHGGKTVHTCPVIVGPTAVGKTTLVTTLASRFPIEVISLDSRQIYRGLGIGTAQPTTAERAECPHHLIDFLSPAETYDAFRFRSDFEALVGEISHRGGVPILVGGAGMYMTALRDGFMEIPGNTPDSLAAARAQLDPLTDQEIRQRLEAVDPLSFRSIHAKDRYRSQRALEIHLVSGYAMSELKAQQRPNPSLGLNFPTFVLTRPVNELDARIAQRTQLMLEQGWIEETEAVMRQHAADCPGLLSIGYREIVAHLQGRLGRQDLVPAIVQVTRQYAKRQRTWFRHIPRLAQGTPDDQVMLEALGQVMAGLG